VDNVENPHCCPRCGPGRCPVLWNPPLWRTLTAHAARPRAHPETAIRELRRLRNLSDRPTCAAIGRTWSPRRPDEPPRTATRPAWSGDGPAQSARERGLTAGRVGRGRRRSDDLARRPFAPRRPYGRVLRGDDPRRRRSTAPAGCREPSPVAGRHRVRPYRARRHWTKGAHPAQTPKKPTFPIFNRKGGLCGTRVPAFYTFSTAVEKAVDNLTIMPAIQQYSS
jgi:hypothetical protein